MGPDDAVPAPDDLDDVPSFKAGLRCLKAWSGMSYRELERKANAAGEPLPATTIADMLSANRPRMPRERQVRALARACGCAEDEVDAWVRARRRIVMAEAAPPDEGAETGGAETGGAETGGETAAPDSPPVRAAGPRHRGTVLTGALTFCGIMLLAAAGAPHVAPAIDEVRPRTARASAGDLPPSGPYRIRLARSGLCMSERRGSTSGLVLLAPCARAFPPRSLERRAGARYRITTDHPEFGPGCMGISKARATPGPYVFDDYCEGTNAGAEEFVLTPVEAPVPGYTIRVVHGGLCLGLPGNTAREGVPLYQMECDRSPRQVFTVEAR